MQFSQRLHDARAFVDVIVVEQDGSLLFLSGCDLLPHTCRVGLLAAIGYLLILAF